MQLEPILCAQAVCGLLGVGMDCLNPPETGFYYMDDSEIRAQLRFSWSLTGTLSMCLQDPSQLLPRHSKPDAPHSQPPVPAPLPAVLGLAERRHQHHGQQQPAGPGELSGCRVPGQQHTTRSRCRVSDLRQRREQWGNRIRPRRAPRPFPSRLYLPRWGHYRRASALFYTEGSSPSSFRLIGCAPATLVHV